MNFEQLKAAFASHALKLSKSTESTAKYRSMNYKKVANIISKHADMSEKVTIKKINDLPITAHMKEKALNFTASDVKTDKRTSAYLSLKPVAQIPHEFIKKFETIIKKLSNKSAKLTLVGSYRRKKPFSSDIDIMITSNKPNIVEEFKKKIQSLFDAHVYSQGNDRISMIIVADITFKIDAFRTCPSEEIPMLLYSTGSKEFNIHMRSVAKKRGYTLNQKGLFKNGILVPDLKSEEDYFNFLHIKYLQPENR